MKVSQILFISLCCCLLCPCLACDKDSVFPVDKEISQLNNTIPNVLLCRMCGLSQEDEGSFLEPILSPFSLSIRNETIYFEKDKKTATATISVQKLRNPSGILFDVVTLKRSSCKGVGKVNSLFCTFTYYQLSSFFSSKSYL